MMLGSSKNLFRFGALLCLASLLFAVATVSASPTVTPYAGDISQSISPADNSTVTPGSLGTIVKPVSAEMANIARQFLKPPKTSAGLTNINKNSTRTLPAVPATILMLTMGFLCVSLYRDRKVWIMVLMGLSWAGQTWIQRIPQLAHHFAHKSHKNQQLTAEIIYTSCLKNSRRSRSDIEGSRYIGLLHHLGGIPNRATTVILSNSQPAIVFCDSMTLQSNCLAFKAERLIRFSPAFIFNNLARGPPILA